MRPIARLTDQISHGGNIIGGSPDVLVNDLPVARLGDPVFCDIHSIPPEGSIQFIVTASLTKFANSLGIASIGDLISCGATITTGSPDVTLDS